MALKKYNMKSHTADSKLATKLTTSLAPQRITAQNLLAVVYKDKH